MKHTTPDPERLRVAAIGAAAAVLFGALAWPLATGAVFHQDDLGTFHLPLRVFFAKCLAVGDDPRWMPAIYCGYYLAGEGQVGMDHPWHRLLYGTLPTATAFHLEFLASYPLLFAGTALFLRRRGLARDASLFGALIFTFSGFNIVHYMHINAIAIVAHLPWLLLLDDAILRADDPRRLAWLKLGATVLTASQVLLGYPQYVGFSMLVEGWYALWLWRRGLVHDTKRLWALGESKSLGLLIGCIQILPTRQALRESWRSRPPREFAAMNSLHPLNVFQAIAPYAFRVYHYNGETDATWPMHESGFYGGAVVPAALAWLWARRRDLGPIGALVKGAIVLGVVALVLSFGQYTPVFPILSRLPFLGLFRGSSRFVLLVHLASAMLAAFAFADVAALRGPLPRRSLRPLLAAPLASLLGVVLLKGLAMAMPGGLLAGQLVSTPRLLCAPLWIGPPALAFYLAARGRRSGLVALILLTAADQALYGLTMIYQHDPPLPIPALVAAESRPIGPTAGSRARIGNDALAMAGVSMADGYVALTPRHVLDEKSPASLRLACVRWLRATDGTGRWQELPDPLPRLRLLTRAVVSKSPKKDIPTIDLDTTALVTRPIDLPAAAPGAARFLDDRPGKVRVETTTGTRQLLVLADSYHDGWRVAVDGKAAKVERVNGDYLGCVVEAGRHEVAFTFDPASYRDGAWLSTLGLALTAASFGIGRVATGRRGRRSISGSRRSAPHLGARANAAARNRPIDA
ncbi:MAG TPA: YfhO family protein [Isosphaeraceae bacterium]|nr:YfhO family protein [Isosphaeraceae bacterium]